MNPGNSPPPASKESAVATVMATLLPPAIMQFVQDVMHAGYSLPAALAAVGVVGAISTIMIRILDKGARRQPSAQLPPPSDEPSHEA